MLSENSNYQLRCAVAAHTLCNGENPPPRIAQYHTSKSNRLPVAAFKVHHYDNGGAYVFVRDNYHDIKLSVLSEFPIHLDYDFVHQKMTQEEYDAEKLRCINYSGDRMSEEEKQGDNWIKGWSGNTILRKDNKIWKAYTVNSCYCEGINGIEELPNNIFSVYQDGMQNFTIALGSWSQVAYLLDLIYASVNRGAYEKLKKLRGE